MNTARILSTVTFAAVAAFASAGAYAAPVVPAAGELSAATAASTFQSVRTRADVAAEARNATPNTGDFYVVTTPAQGAVVTRAEVRGEAVTAVRANEIATGNFS